ncbi:hypothetical protein E2320_014400 [Naja naja]|nr:hypothetical protein E2320_014400 [Naja naja]
MGRGTLHTDALRRNRGGCGAHLHFPPRFPLLPWRVGVASPARGFWVPFGAGEAAFPPASRPPLLLPGDLTTTRRKGAADPALRVFFREVRLWRFQARSGSLHSLQGSKGGSLPGLDLPPPRPAQENNCDRRFTFKTTNKR